MATEEKPKQKRSWGCCLLKVFLAMFLLGVLGLVGVGVIVYRSASWFKNVAQPEPATYQPLKISEGEEQDVNRIISELANGKKNKTLIDETVTPTVFNGIMERIIAGEKAKGNTNGPDGIRGGFDGQHFSLEFSAPEKSGKHANADGPMYVNGKLNFDLEIEEGKIIHANVNNLNVGGREAPWAVKAFINYVLIGQLKKAETPEMQKAAHGFKAFKLFKREGERLHIILDPAYFKDENGKADVPAPPASTTPDEKTPEKTTF